MIFVKKVGFCGSKTVKYSMFLGCVFVKGYDIICAKG